MVGTLRENLYASVFVKNNLESYVLLKNYTKFVRDKNGTSTTSTGHPIQTVQMYAVRKSKTSNFRLLVFVKSSSKGLIVPNVLKVWGIWNVVEVLLKKIHYLCSIEDVRFGYSQRTRSLATITISEFWCFFIYITTWCLHKRIKINVRHTHLFTFKHYVTVN